MDALTVFDDGSGPALYAGGDFETAGGANADNVAKWNGSAWSALGSGISSRVLTLTVFDDGSGPALYAAGGFGTAGGVSANRIAKWDGATWSPLGTGMDQAVSAMMVFDDGSGPALYAGGEFITAGGVGVSRIATWDGSSWSGLGGGSGNGMNDSVHDLTVFDDGSGPALYAGGQFTTAGGVNANRIAKWDGSTWSPLGSGMGELHDFNAVSALTVFDDGFGPALYAGGDFTIAGGVEANNIAKWDGSTWSALGSGLGRGRVVALTVFDDGSGPALYVGGDFRTAGGVTVDNIAKWNGTAWSALGIGMSSRVQALTVFDDGSGPALYAGGNFTIAGGVSAAHIAKWDGSTWSALGSGTNDTVFALTGFDDGSGPALYAGGNFTIAGGLTERGIAKWDGSAWSPVGDGLTWSVFALTVFDYGPGPALYAGGSFWVVGEVNIRTKLARWDGSTWSPLGSGMNRSVGALAVFDDGLGAGRTLYAGGYFNTAGGKVSTFIAKLSPVGPMDPDGDGLRDCVDNCPNDFNPDQDDCDADGTGDVCAIASGLSQDCNANSIPDTCDLAGGTSSDCSGNGIIDECEPDCQANGIPDDCDILSGTSEDCVGPPTNCFIVRTGERGCDHLFLESCVCAGFQFCCDSAWVSTCVQLAELCSLCDPGLAGNGIPDECDTLCNDAGECDDTDECTIDTCNDPGFCSHSYAFDPARECCNPTTGELTLLENGEPCTVGICNPDDGTVTRNNVLDGPAIGCSPNDPCYTGGCVGGTCLITPGIYGDVNGDRVINIFDLLCVLSVFSGDFSKCSLERTDIEPCAGDDTINVFDLLALLGAFAGIDPCCGGVP